MGDKEAVDNANKENKSVTEVEEQVEDPATAQKKAEEEIAAQKRKEAHYQKKSQELRRERGRKKGAFTRLRSKLSTLMVEGNPPSEISLRLNDLTACFREVEYTHEEYVSYILDDKEYDERLGSEEK